jgi:hypothetical protein
MNENQVEALQVEDVETEETVTTPLTVAEVVADLYQTIDKKTTYGIWKLIDGALDVFEYEGKRPTSQYIYNYSRNGMIAKRTVKPNKDHSYTEDEIIAFVTKYVTKKIG